MLLSNRCFAVLGLIALLPVCAARAATTATIDPLADFSNQTGATPSPLVEGQNGIYYGTTMDGGSDNVGTVFEFDPTSDTVTTLHTFTNTPDGANPYSQARLCIDASGNIYGTTYGGGAHNAGSVFEIDSMGQYSILHSFDAFHGDRNIQGSNPEGGVTLGGNSDLLYGVTSYRGPKALGTIFKLNIVTGEFNVLHSFSTQSSGDPEQTLTRVGGTFYGTTEVGGDPNGTGGGTVFQITQGGVYTALYSFPSKSSSNMVGASPSTPLVFKGGSLYGGTSDDGANGDGTLYKVSLNGDFSLVLTFAGTNGSKPTDLILGSDGNLYGTVYRVGSAPGGVFEYKTIHSLYDLLFSFPPIGKEDESADGGDPTGLVELEDGTFYGSNGLGGPGTGGVIYQLFPGS